MGTAGGELVTLLAPLHVQNEDALLIGILFGLIVLIAALPGGLSLLLDWGKEKQVAEAELLEDPFPSN
jgi:hypothetical protein